MVDWVTLRASEKIAARYMRIPRISIQKRMMIPKTHEEVGIEEFGDCASRTTVLLNDGVPKVDSDRSTTAND